ncbi:hypothetical protein CI102_8117 [Trichoderma harzianum]|nr:hypothetical protein CI102_8117 [Trichoderma harzianum]
MPGRNLSTNVYSYLQQQRLLVHVLQCLIGPSWVPADATTGQAIDPSCCCSLAPVVSTSTHTVKCPGAAQPEHKEPSRNRHPCIPSNHVSLQRFQLDSCGAAVHLDPDMTFFARRYRFYCLLCFVYLLCVECLRPLWWLTCSGEA